ncbi:MAG TPA: RNA polymerase sigma factor RpoD/SigA [Candidatus Omnitrophota bacterium]|nr:RNA polymerase sigma factor RpoD [Candidatus Omnitrophota bacterium]HRK61906.1 RNA polymerase sigma factor RpoD/SigA [Candidatus Omnitrophota bacterium]
MPAKRASKSKSSRKARKASPVKKVKRRALSVSKKKRAKAVVLKPKKTAAVEPLKKDALAFVAGKTEDRRAKKREMTLPQEGDGQYENTADRSAMRIYLDQIEHIPLLTPDDEVTLARKVQAGGNEGAQARERMIKSNLRLVIAIAKRYSNMGLPFSDLVEEGNMGLMRAVEKFDPERGYRFSTYSSWWIKQGIMRSLSNQGKTIRIPVYMYDIIAKWRKVRDGLTQRLGKVPSAKEIADVMEVPVEKIREIEQIVERPSSLNAPISLEGTAELIDLIEEDSSKNPDALLSEVLCSERVVKLLETLDERERRILNLRFGLAEGQTHTLEEVAAHFDITRERVRQIEAAALKKIRKYLEDQGDRLENYLAK